MRKRTALCKSISIVSPLALGTENLGRAALRVIEYHGIDDCAVVTMAGGDDARGARHDEMISA